MNYRSLSAGAWIPLLELRTPEVMFSEVLQLFRMRTSDVTGDFEIQSGWEPLQSVRQEAERVKDDIQSHKNPFKNPKGILFYFFKKRITQEGIKDKKHRYPPQVLLHSGGPGASCNEPSFH